MASVETIAAIATAPGRAAIGVVRISGANLRAMAQLLLSKPPVARRAVLCDFLDQDKQAIDQGIALYFPAPHSYTGQDVLELQGHGGPAVLQLLLRRCLAVGARLAEPGEFTRRAFLNHKLDLAQAESVADLIEASSGEAAKSAMRSLQGAFSIEVNALANSLIELRMLIEGSLDFPEEEDIKPLARVDAVGRLQAIRKQLEKVKHAARQGNILREGITVVLAGRPNVGKSSLLNRLAGEEVAIVTSIPGTTRDAVRQSIEIEGVPLHIVDTAGLRNTKDEVEKIGIARTWETIGKADAVLLIMDCTHGKSREDRQIFERLPSRLHRICVYNKIDLLPDEPKTEAVDGEIRVYVSAKTGSGIDLLRSQLLATVGWQPTGEGVFMARERHLSALQKAQEHLSAALERQDQIELFAEELRLAQNAVSNITGEFSSDDLLGEIFSRFCIGK
ncbi:MAG TPA: tRNA uridine-5-carboxymethylaminomethyl(34) synthesis GTPase MnmE [Burkholderiales bacterium]|nr:tRNA uridine-5-carboxymethylaminomethyl(34) synthesis GTPase MnmE [Burkholderiales bacterium]